MKTKITIIALSIWSVLSFLALIGSALNSEEWKDSLHQWEQAVKERDKSIESLQTQLSQAQAQITTCQKELDLNTQKAKEPDNTKTKTKTDTAPKKSVPLPGGLCLMKAGFIVATTEDIFDQAESLLIHDDKVALQKLMDRGTVGVSVEGKEVYLDKVKMFAGKVRIRVKGSPDTLWTNFEAIKCN